MMVCRQKNYLIEAEFPRLRVRYNLNDLIVHSDFGD